MVAKRMDAEKQQKFRERLARISRRRFMKTMATGGAVTAAGVMLYKKNASAQGRSQASETATALPDRCKNTRRILDFKGATMEFILSVSLQRLLNQAVSGGLVSKSLKRDVRNVANLIGPKPTVVDFYEDPALIPAGSELFKAFNNCEPNFSIPFRYIDDDDRAAAARLLKPGGEFRVAFGDKTYSYIHDNSTFDQDEVNALAAVNAIGVFSAYPRRAIAAEVADRCASTDMNGNWNCNVYSAGDKCSIVNGAPSGDSDICYSFERPVNHKKKG